MGCSHRKLSETGLRIVGTFLKVKLCVGATGSTGSGALNIDVKLGGISQVPLNIAPILAARPSKVKKIGASRRKVY